MPDMLPEHIGIDFGNHSVKALFIRGTSSKKPTLEAVATHVTPFGVINSYEEDKKNQLITVLKELRQELDTSTKEVVVALPESSIFTRVVDLPALEEDDVMDALYWEVKQYLPIPIEEVKLGSVQLSVDKASGTRKMLAVAAPIKLVELYTELLEKAGFLPVAMESEALATLRTVSFSYGVDEAITLDFGSQATDMAIMKQGDLYFSQSISTGSDMLTRALMNDFQLAYAQAEEYKRTYGMNKGVLEDKVFASLKPILDIILTEIQRGVEFFKSQTGEVAPAQTFLTGDGSLLPGLTEYIKEQLGMDSQPLDPFVKINIPAKFQKAVVASKSAYTVVTGLALKYE